MPRAARDAVAACVARLAPDAALACTLVARRHYSRVYRVALEGRVIAVKECLDGAGTPDPANARREHAALCALARATQEAGCAPLGPLPLVLCDDVAAFAMTWAEGRPLTQAVLDRRTTLAHAGSLGEAAGTWLRRFHGLAATDASTHDFTDRIDYAAGIAGRAPRDRLLARASHVLAELAARAAAVAMPRSWIHGDMKSDNLIVGAGATLGLDVQLADRNTVVYDVAPFLNHLALLALSVKGVLRRQALHALRDGFLRAYSDEAAQWNLPIAWLRTYLLMQASAPAARGSALRRAIAAWPTRRALAGALHELEALGASA